MDHTVIIIFLIIIFVCLRQDVAFYDANKTGQLVNRLTADIQEFKSSFKLVISQVENVNLHKISMHSMC